jgi:hypothetical protein
VENGEDRWERIRRKLRERRCGQVRRTMTVIVTEIIPNERGLGNDLRWRIDPPMMIGGII